jgi:hydroxymethylbilane synthase
MNESGARRLVVGTRGSELARSQTEEALAPLRRLRPQLDIEIRVIRTTGDREQRASLSLIGGAGVFVKEIERALLLGEIDLAVHSAKDLPPALDPALLLMAVPPRADPRDAFVSRDNLKLPQLPIGSRIGTGSARRRSMLLRARPDLEIVDIRGNVESRVARLHEGSIDGVVLAASGLGRLGRLEEASEIFSPDVMLPAPGQGALAIEGRRDDAMALELTALLDEPISRACVTAERAFLAQLGSGCSLPVGAYARCVDDRIELQAVIFSTATSSESAASMVGGCSDAEALGANLAAHLMNGFGLDEGGR